MTVAYLDILKFSELMKSNPIAVQDNLSTVIIALESRRGEDRRALTSLHESDSVELSNSPDPSEPSDSLEPTSHQPALSDPLDNKWMLEDIQEINMSGSSFVLAGNSANEFVLQIANFVALTYITCARPFRDMKKRREKVCSDHCFEVDKSGKLIGRKAAPLLFRGGVCDGVHDDLHYCLTINNFTHKYELENVYGKTSSKACSLASLGNGPRLFCDHVLVEAISDNKVRNMIRKVSGREDIYEIVWTMEGCGAYTENCSSSYGSDHSSNRMNVNLGINDMLIPAIKIYQYYPETEDEDSKHLYEELLEIICCGIARYAEVECDGADYALEVINKTLKGILKDEDIPTVNGSILKGFIN